MRPQPALLQAELCKEFPEEDCEARVWRGLLLVAAGLTLATVAAVIARR